MHPQAYDQYYPILMEFNLCRIIFLGKASLLQSEFAEMPVEFCRYTSL
jgi:hypothetical protein